MTVEITFRFISSSSTIRTFIFFSFSAITVPPGGCSVDGASCPHRCGEYERASLAGLAFNMNTAAVQLNKTPAQAQAQAGARILPREACFHLLERLEKLFLIFRGTAEAVCFA